MAQIIEAIYTNGMLKILGDLSLEEQQHVLLTIEPLDDVEAKRKAAIARFKVGVERSSFQSQGPLPSRDDLHDRA